jgi:hypothetical protein
LREITLTIVYPSIQNISSGCRNEFPVAGIITFSNQFSRSPITQSETRRVRVDSRITTVPHCKSHVTSTRNIDAIESILFSRQRRVRGIDLKIFFLAVESRKTDNRRALKHAKRNSFIAQRENLESRAWSQPYEIASVDLDLQTTVSIGCNGVAFD